jgi:Protein of unknown function (DUF2627)
VRGLVAWTILLGFFILAGEGLNLLRLNMEDYLAYGDKWDILWGIAGLGLAFVCTAFLAGFVYFRDKKRGKLKREGWLGRPIKRERVKRDDSKN